VLRIRVNGERSASVRAGDRVRFDVERDGVPFEQPLECDFEGTGTWAAESGATFRHTYRDPGHFSAVIRASGESDTVDILVKRVTVSGGAGIW
jgi:hypothetical protein